MALVHPGQDLTTAACAPAVSAPVAASVWRHDRAAFRAQRGVQRDLIKREAWLWIPFRRPQSPGVAGFGGCVLRAQKLYVQPAEDVVHDGFRIRDLRVSCPAAWLETNVGKLLH